ncbi:hypothetical protein [Zavarzinella formosa]|uniref:hypothetical protein n=1 Tax=Zavarzinella formosa TaxID=360055 RepID=UPI000310628E|nr:hypothetical protein [Zavarzinella formosa]
MNNFEDESMRLAGWLRHAAEQAEAHVEQADRLIRAVVTTGHLAPGVIVGPAVLQHDYHPDAGREDSALVARLILHAPRGLGVAWWDVDVHYERSQEEGALEEDARCGFVPFAECEIAVKASCLPHIAGLLLEMRSRLRS